MKKKFELDAVRGRLLRIVMLLLAGAFRLANISSMVAQKDKKKKKDDGKSTGSSKAVLPMGDEQQIDYMLSEMLGAWQLGDIEKLHSKYADDVSMVNGSWAPPVLGWTNYLAIYQQLRSEEHTSELQSPMYL